MSSPRYLIKWGILISKKNHHHLASCVVNDAGFQVIIRRSRSAKPSALLSVALRMPNWLRSGRTLCPLAVRPTRVSRRTTIDHILVISVKFVWQTVIHVGILVLFPSLRDSPGPFFPQMLLQDHGVSGIAFVHGVCEVSNEWDEANDKIKDNVHGHLHPQRCRKAAVDILATLQDHQCEKGIEDVSGTTTWLVSGHIDDSLSQNLHRNQSNYAPPAKPDATQTEQAQI